ESVLEATENVSGVESVINPFETDGELSDQQQELEDGRQELADAQKQLDGAPEQLDAAEAELDSSEQDLDAAQEQLDAGIDQATAAGMPETAAQEQFATQQAQLDAAREELEAGRQQLEDERESYEEGLTEVEEGQTLTDLGDRLLETSNDYAVVSDNDSAAIATAQFGDQSINVYTPVRERVVAALRQRTIERVEVIPPQEISMAVSAVLGCAEVVGLVVAGIVLVVMLETFKAVGLP